MEYSWLEASKPLELWESLVSHVTIFINRFCTVLYRMLLHVGKCLLGMVHILGLQLPPSGPVSLLDEQGISKQSAKARDVIGTITIRVYSLVCFLYYAENKISCRNCLKFESTHRTRGRSHRIRARSHRTRQRSHRTRQRSHRTRQRSHRTRENFE